MRLWGASHDACLLRVAAGRCEMVRRAVVFVSFCGVHPP